MITKKITNGFVVQTYHDDHCVEQEFFATDEFEWEDADGEPIERPKGAIYQPFTMTVNEPED